MAIFRGAFWWAGFGWFAAIVYMTLASFSGVPIAGQGGAFLWQVWAFAAAFHAIGGGLLGVNVIAFGEKPVWIGVWGAIFGTGCGLASARRIVAEIVPWNHSFFIGVGCIGAILGFLSGIGVLAGEVRRR